MLVARNVQHGMVQDPIFLGLRGSRGGESIAAQMRTGSYLATCACGLLYTSDARIPDQRETANEYEGGA